MEKERDHQAYVQGVVDNYLSYCDPGLYDLPLAFREDPSLSSFHCPACRGQGRWRRGQEFEHMMRCGKCDVVWSPGEVDRLKKELADKQCGTFGDGI